MAPLNRNVINACGTGVSQTILKLSVHNVQSMHALLVILTKLFALNAYQDTQWYRQLTIPAFATNAINGV